MFVLVATIAGLFAIGSGILIWAKGRSGGQRRSQQLRISPAWPGQGNVPAE
jgi:hypothetical protein